MQYGYFDEANREYVITNPATPAPWANYLGDPAYGAIISNNAGGYSFVKSGGSGRILRYRFNDNDDPGRYIYLQDTATNDFWSASWQPVAKPLDVYKSECHHGTAYTKISAVYSGIESEVAYYVPLGSQHEVWRLRITNKSGAQRALRVFGYAEFTTNGNYEQDQVNLQYTQFITRTYFHGSYVQQVINENVKATADGNSRASRFFGLAGAAVESYNGDKEAFLGRYNGYAKPAALQAGRCNNMLNYNANPCGALQTTLTLAAGESREICFVLGQKEPAEAQAILQKYENVAAACHAELHALRTYWHEKLNAFCVTTPDENFNAMVNTWNAYQCFTTFVWSRAASFYYCGQRNGYGYRDTVQDIQGILHLDAAMAKKQLVFMLSAQVHHGGGLPLVKYTHTPGCEDTPDDESYAKATGHPAYRADDALWLFPTVKKYIDETGELSFLDEVIPFADKDEGTVYNHLQRAVDFSLQHMAAHGMPAGLHADWNDCLRLGPAGESTFVAMQLYMAMQILHAYAVLRGDAPTADAMQQHSAALLEVLQTVCWDEDRFIRGIREDGTAVGAKHDAEASLWLNPQSWSVLSGVATPAQAATALDRVHAELNTPYGARLFEPCYKDHAFDGALMILFNASTKENGGIFSQPQGWLILAEAMLGHGNRAYEYFTESCPAAMNAKAEIRKLEPYVHGQFTEAVHSPFAGRSHVHWLTGTASTVMVACVEGILGMRPCPEGLYLAPCLPAHWGKVEIQRVFRGKALHITILNPHHRESDMESITLNGLSLADNFISADSLLDQNEIEIVL